MKYSEMTLEKVKKRKEYFRNYQVLYYQRNKGRIDLKNKLYAETHRADAVKRNQKYEARHKGKVQSYRHAYNRKVAGKWRSIKSSSKVREIELSLTREDFEKLTSGNCAYCGDSRSPLGIDRIDNSKGYTLENSTSCCKICNYMKKNLSVENFISHITKIYSHDKN